MSSLQKQYVKVLLDLLEDSKEVETSIGRLKEVMIKRGHQKLLPAVLKDVERQLSAISNPSTLTVAHESDVDKYQELNKEAEVLVDEKIIGGYILKDKYKLTDNSHRSRLLNWYKSVINN